MPSSSTTPAHQAVRERFNDAWDEFSAAVRRARSRVVDRRDMALTPAQYHLLSALRDGRSRNVGELAAAAGVSSPTATRMLDALEREGVVVRRPSDEDRRRISVEMTEAGEEAMAQARGRREQARDLVYAELSPEERAQAVHLLSRLAEAIEQV